MTAEQLAQLLESVDLNVPTEEDELHALMVWIQYDFDTREKFIPELLGLICLPLLPPAVRVLFDFHFDINQKRSAFVSIFQFIADYVENLCA